MDALSLLIDRAIGRIRDVDASLSRHDGSAVDWVDLNWMQCRRRANRVSSRAGRELKILLRLGETLAHGDILWRSASLNTLVAVNVLESEVIVGRPGDAKRFALLAYELGNLHVPIELDGEHIITLDDGPVLEALEKIGVEFQKSLRRFAPTAMGTPVVSLAAEFRIERK